MDRRGKLAVIAAATLLSVPAALATPFEQPVVTSHTTYANMDGNDPCIAAIAGILRLRVMWFGEQVLFEREAQEGQNYVYAIEHGAPDPREVPLTPTGEVYQFPDPNGVEWSITEYNFTSNVKVSPPDGGNVNTTLFPPNPNVTLPDEGGAEVVYYYVWVVRTGPTTQDPASGNRPYNFVNLVDTCKFRDAGQDLSHADTNGNWTSSDGNDTTEDQHLPSDSSHPHKSFNVDLYVGSAPKLLVPEGTSDFLGEPQ